MPLYDILNEFQKGSSHMAAVVKVKGKSKSPWPEGEKFEEEKVANGNSQVTVPFLTNHDDKSESVVVDIEKPPRPIINKQNIHKNGAVTSSLLSLSEDIEDGEVIGIITLEDVFEELLQVSLYFYHYLYLEFSVDLPDLWLSSSSPDSQKIVLLNACTNRSNVLIKI